VLYFQLISTNIGQIQSFFVDRIPPVFTYVARKIW